ncbi:CoA-acylating methylmalonate-semialdehyde dehydrogenase [Alphaproteobacteria bacterium]|nr:CoA-acylating methylmalonate-semialdehyde dehydrogenase [Alphaproteobacteria bacterium]
MLEISNFIGGKHMASETKSYIKLYKPTTGEEYARVPLSTENEFNKMINSMKLAQLEWSETSLTKRSSILFKFKNLVEQNFNEIATIISNEHGKVLSDAKGSLQRGLEVVDFACGIPHLLKGSHSINVGTNVDSYDIRQPLGISAGITPFNFPAMVPMWMFPMSIACGNAFLLKPSEKVPQCSMKLAELFSEAGLPDNILNIIHGDKSVVDLILQSADVASVSFVGSTPVAQYIYSESAKYNKKVQALGGAKNHMVIMEDANLEDAVNGLIGAAFGSAGERCMATSVALPVGKIQKPFMELLMKKANSINVGGSLDPNSEMGPLITKEHKAKVIKYIECGVTEGAKLEMDGRNISLQGFENGNFVGPTIFNNVTRDMTIYKEEIFGPVLSVVNVDTYEEAIDHINSHEFGNGTSVYTSNGNIARNFTKNVQIGMVGINIPIPVPMAFYSFGGWKGSIFGGSGMHGEEGINFYTRRKTVTTKWADGVTGASLVMPTMK